MAKLQWDHFERKIYIKTTAKKIYSLWATEEGLLSWFLREANFVSPNGAPKHSSGLAEVGDSYTWRWHNWDGKTKGKITQANGLDFLEFSFEESMVSVKFEEKNDVVIVTLKQFNIPEDDDSKLKIYYGCSNGWTFWLTNLKAYIEHGILLNETEFNLKEQELAGYVFVNM